METITISYDLTDVDLVDIDRNLTPEEQAIVEAVLSEDSTSYEIVEFAYMPTRKIVITFSNTEGYTMKEAREELSEVIASPDIMAEEILVALCEVVDSVTIHYELEENEAEVDRLITPDEQAIVEAALQPLALQPDEEPKYAITNFAYNNNKEIAISFGEIDPYSNGCAHRSILEELDNVICIALTPTLNAFIYVGKD